MGEAVGEDWCLEQIKRELSSNRHSLEKTGSFSSNIESV